MCRFFHWSNEVGSFELELWSLVGDLNLENKAAIFNLDLKLSTKLDEIEMTLVVWKYAFFALFGIMVAVVIKYFGI